MQYNILIVKESKHDEQRVSLIPADAARLIHHGHQVIVESQAGIASGFNDQDYQTVGATIRYPDENLTNLFIDVDLIVRVKRPDRIRESIENTLLNNKIIMLGALDPFEPNSTHIDEYKKVGISAYSIDQLDIAPSDPMNILASMSEIAGKLALQDAMQKAKIDAIRRCVVIGAGTAGMAAINEALLQKLHVQVVVSDLDKATVLQQKGAQPILIKRDLSLVDQQALVCIAVEKADIVIATARRPKQKAPILIPAKTLEKMQPGACIVDLALSEGGNVEGSEHDNTLLLGNQVIVTNVSGYPKSQPILASEKWSKASVAFIELFAQDRENTLIQSAKIS